VTDEESTTNRSVTPTGDGYYEETVVEYVDNSRSRKILALILVLLFLLLVGAGYYVVRIAQPAGAPTSSTLPAGISWIRSFYSFGPAPSQMLEVPTATDFGPDGTVWTLAGKRYIVGFSPAGQVRHVIAPTGTFLRSWGVQLPQVIDVKGNRVAVAASNGIGLFDTQGKLVAKWGSRGAKADQVDLPHGIVIGADGTIYVSDTHNGRVKAYTQGGRLLWMIADPSHTGSNLVSTQTSVSVVNGVSQNMQLPAGLTQDASGRLLMVDPFTFQILVLDPAHKGRIVARYGAEGQQDGQFTYPTGISYDAARDLIAVADTTNNRMQLIRIPGTGGNVVARTLTSLTDTPVWLCGLPLLLLVIALVLWLRGRRRDRDEEAAESVADDAPAGE
jgi:sugar lactone lactonase YvrE